MNDSPALEFQGPVKVTELSNGIAAVFADRQTATLTMDGASCTCRGRAETPCTHIPAALPYYERRKWTIVEANHQNYGPTFLRRLGLDPRVFNPPAVQWSQFPHDEPFVWVGIGQGRLFIFRDGAFFWESPTHPDGRTKCARCGLRDCPHVQEVLSWARERQAQATTRVQVCP